MVNIILSALIAGLLIVASPLQAKPHYRFKVASLAPEGSVWVNHFHDFATEVSQKSGGDIDIRVYPGGVMGDDLAMYRKIRAGQLHGGGFTMTGISNAVPDFRIMAVPSLFDNYEEIDVVSNTLLPFFIETFRKSDLEFLSLTEVGLVYGMSTTPTTTINDLKQRKSWIPSGDPVTAAYLKTLNITPVPLTIPDVLPSLQTGLIDTVYTSLYGTIVMQWFTKATYITDIPYGYAYGAVVFSKKAFAKLPPEYQEIVHKAAKHHFTALNKQTRKTNIESREVLLQNGVTFVKAAAGTAQVLKKSRDEAVLSLQDKAFSREAFDRVVQILKQIRSPGQ